jgi:membrane protein required for colicin V production
MSDASITVIDVLVTAVILVSAGFAMWRGLVGETFTIIDWVLAAFVALRVTPMFQPLLREVISPPWLEYIVVFIGSFLLMFIPLSILNHRLSEMVKKSEIGPVDRVLGFVFGVGRGLVIVGIAYIAFAAMVPLQDHPQSLTGARSFPLIRQTSEVLLNLASSRGANAVTLGTRAAERSTLPLPARAAADRPEPPKGNAQAGQGGEPTKTYGADERSALDRLIETTGAGQGSSK